MDYPKRLIEVDLPIKRISAHARREKSIRHGHISTLHIWWARRPLAACRAVICAALWPDPADEKCPTAFRDEARRLMTDWAKNHLDLTSPESMSRFNRVKNDPKVLADNIELRKSLLDFIADFANWDNSAVVAYLQTAQSITHAAHLAAGGHSSPRPLVIDPFAGGGSIPLEALRVGADVFASDLNPIPVLLNRVVLDYVPKYGEMLAQEVRKWGSWIGEKANERLAEYYPADTDGSTPIAYLWARTITCEGPGCGAVVPMIRSLLLARKSSRAVALKLTPQARTKTLHFSILTRVRGKWTDVKGTPAADPELVGTVKRGAVTCPFCNFTTPITSVRTQLKKRRGGADDAMLFCVVRVSDNAAGRSYRPPTQHDADTFKKAQKALERKVRQSQGSVSWVPDEPLPVMSGVFNAPLYGHSTWGSLFSARQLLTLGILKDLIGECAEKVCATTGDPGLAKAVNTCLALTLSRGTDLTNSLCVWKVDAECPVHLFGRQAIPMVWEYAEAVTTANASGSWSNMVERTAASLESVVGPRVTGSAELADAGTHPLPDDSAHVLLTDPPYYNAVPYADLSDFFYVWLKRALKELHPDLFRESLAPKKQEICEMAGWDSVRYPEKDSKWFETQMGKAMAESRRVLMPSGIGIVVFAHKSTEGWEAQLQAMVDAGWVFTGSWPIDTEQANRLRALNSAALGSSVHLVCRPREAEDGAVLAHTVGDWRQVLTELPSRIHEWMPRLAEEGVVGADAIFACLGPALEIFSRYSRVEKASGEVVTLREYLEQVWAAVSTEALSMIFQDADAAGLESDARFTAIVLWTLGAGGSGSGESGDIDAQDADGEDDEEDSPKGKAANGGYTLEYDAARKIAQGLGVNLEQIESVVEVKGDKARLRAVSERAATLFGKAEKAEAATKKRGKKTTQKKLFDKDAEEGGGKTETVTLGDGATATPSGTALDRVHQAMLLFAGGRADALKRFIVEDGVGGDARFWKLAQSLSALYPAGSDEKRWVDGVLARKKSFGF